MPGQSRLGSAPARLSCASSGRAWPLGAARRSQEEAVLRPCLWGPSHLPATASGAASGAAWLERAAYREPRSEAADLQALPPWTIQVERLLPAVKEHHQVLLERTAPGYMRQKETSPLRRLVKSTK